MIENPIEFARRLVANYYNERVDKTDDTKITKENVYVVWFNYTLGNWKCLLSTNIPDGMYYEITYSGEKEEAYVDAYKKLENITAKDETDIVPKPGHYDVVPVIKTEGGQLQCSKCKRQIKREYISRKTWSFCPKCGARLYFPPKEKN